MSKSPTLRRLGDDEANASHPMLRVSPRKLNLIAGAIRGKTVEDALAFLKFDKKRISKDVKKILMSAVSNAENNHNLDIDQLVVSEAVVGKSVVMKRVMPAAKGRATQIHKPFSRINICVAERLKETK
ncbi:MAG: 50S ribosomal protein L22 [Alphaproteobacteria bacterium 16-39-46]|nr:MAG: 50S ribosomal protein L22 [Alphaproteobacteria bacterium 16-39-46]OZA42921.1 MAG: 50S ribosomal protein L22 [Alphaproteobacteria bacterium 17-39-52]HQS84216.1 50S ribosomal protein L22 [Alphaproteobacteria bacterium]HQS94081.1 50S ribosomal protein L22 [Alphaproteobacteria bacterium]